MAVTPHLFGLFPKSLANKEIDMDSDTLKFALFTPSLTINQDTHQYFDVTPYNANEISTIGGISGYTAGGVTVSPGSLSYDSATKRLYFSYSNPSWNPITIPSPGARYGILYDSTPASNKPLVLYADLGSAQIFSGGIMTITWSTSPAGTGYIGVS
jgi:hypothetical protein